MNDSERAQLRTIYSWGPAPNGSVISGYVLNKSVEGQNETGRTLISEVYGLGRNASVASLQDYTVSKVNEDLGLKGNMSYLYALLDLDGNATKSQVEAFAREWATNHDLSDPGILPDAVVRQMARGDLTLFVVGLKAAEDSDAASDAVVTARADVKALLQEPQFTGLKAYVTGAAAMSLDAKTTSLQDMDNIDKISVVLILVLLCLYFRSVVTPVVPLLAIGTGIVICFGVLHLLTFAIPLFYLILTLCVVIMLGAGTDYCVFTLSRYAEERALGRDVKASVITAVEHAGKSVASSGLTAMIGFSALLIVDQGIFGGIGIGIAFGVLVSLFVALTLLPGRAHPRRRPAVLASQAVQHRDPGRRQRHLGQDHAERPPTLQANPGAGGAGQHPGNLFHAADQPGQRLRGQHGPRRREQTGLRRDQRRLRQRHRRQAHGRHDAAAGRQGRVGQYHRRDAGSGRKRLVIAGTGTGHGPGLLA